MKESQLIKKFIIENGELKSFKTGELIISPSKKTNDLFLIESGEARLIFNVNNKRTTLKKFQPGIYRYFLYLQKNNRRS